MEPRWSAVVDGSNEFYKVPTPQWLDIARYISEIRDWKDCLSYAAGK